MAELTDSEIQRLFGEAESKAETWNMPEDSSGANIDCVPMEWLRTLEDPPAIAKPSAEEVAAVEAVNPPEAESSSGGSDDGTGVLDQDAISDLVAQAQKEKEAMGQAKEEAPPTEMAPAESSSEMAPAESSSDVLSQDDIANLVAQTQAEAPAPAEPPVSAPGETESSGNDVLSQDDIASLVAQTQAEAPVEQPAAEAPPPPPPPPEPQPGDDDSVMTQDDIANLVSQTQAEAAQSKVEPPPQAAPPPPPQAPDDQGTLSQGDIEKLINQSQDAPAPAEGQGVMSQDDIASMILKEKQQQQQAAADMSETDISALFGEAPAASDESDVLSQDNIGEMFDSKETSASAPSPSNVISKSDLDELLNKSKSSSNVSAESISGPDDGIMSKEQVSDALKVAAQQEASQPDTQAAKEQLAKLMQTTDNISKKLEPQPEPRVNMQFQPPDGDEFDETPPAPKKIKKKGLMQLGVAALIFLFIGVGGYLGFPHIPKLFATESDPVEKWDWEANAKKKSTVKGKVFKGKTTIIVSYFKKSKPSDFKKIGLAKMKKLYAKQKQLKQFQFRNAVTYYRGAGDDTVRMHEFNVAIQNKKGTNSVKKTVFFTNQGKILKLDYFGPSPEYNPDNDSDAWANLDKIFEKSLSISEQDRSDTRYLGDDYKGFKKSTQYFADRATGAYEE